MDLIQYKDKLDKLNFENRTFKFISSVLSMTVLLEGILVVNRVNSEKIVVLPPVQQIKEFWIQGKQVSTSYLEMMSDVIIYNVINIASGKNPNIDFLLAMVPSEHYNEIRASITKQIKYVQDNGITQVFYTSGYNVDNKGLIAVKGTLKQIIGDKIVSSTQQTLFINYNIDYGRFWITGIALKQDGININKEN
ncbi:putative conjugative transfer protein TraE [Campylobacter hyointestinalis subsp. hyointestinalis]|uniref:Conjugative transfer protein TraE n=1 Tax=Campylobacter hyointestinalis subsp. hyointestinalis TaxID=91352 RepID=A0A0S4SU60_CAMHY|nr:TraE/TraK family type IV conjugative transfer system protein [Campylobacter hyointestinalis]CUU89998.1 putative conjugative transfer protein TraE [Campylobacter hyointestinalis subsp. hyointestinalis]